MDYKLAGNVDKIIQNGVRLLLGREVFFSPNRWSLIDLYHDDPTLKLILSSPKKIPVSSGIGRRGRRLSSDREADAEVNRREEKGWGAVSSSIRVTRHSLGQTTGIQHISVLEQPLPWDSRPPG